MTAPLQWPHPFRNGGQTVGGAAVAVSHSVRLGSVRLGVSRRQSSSGQTIYFDLGERQKDANKILETLIFEDRSFNFCDKRGKKGASSSQT